MIIGCVDDGGRALNVISKRIFRCSLNDQHG
jgi:hypothetical protein